MPDSEAPDSEACRLNIERLADLLIARHLRIAVPDSAVRDRLAKSGDTTAIGYDVELVERNMRCIAVVGAGASAPLVDRSDDLAKALEARFGRDEPELERLSLVNNLPPDEFEIRLMALGTSPAAKVAVRTAISDMYNVRSPSLLGYELIAHLLKHRFFDAIISFNFDELLDQSLDDELDTSEYHAVVSERDCATLRSDPNAPGYVPLYVKLHGTASEPESLRFTPQAYYAIPPAIARVVGDLLRSELCVIANFGSKLGSFDFQRMLGIPKRLDVFNLSHTTIPERVHDKIEAERDKAHPLSPKPWLHECNASGLKCDALLQSLSQAIESKAKPASGEQPGQDCDAASGRGLDQLVKYRSVLRHETITKLLGSDRIPDVWATTPEWVRQERIDYCRRRTILELALSGAKARGLLSLVPLTVDRPARYYNHYQQLTEGRGDNWAAFCSAAGLEESDVPDILLSDKNLQKDPGSMSSHEVTKILHEFDPEKLAKHVLARIKNPFLSADVDLLSRTITELQKESDVEFHIRDDRVCSKAFEHPITLTTATSLHAYTWLMLEDLKEEDKIYMSSETGGWLLDPATKDKLQDHQIDVLLAFDIELGQLEPAYSRLTHAVIDPWRHNRHMTIVCEGDRPVRAIYFARRLRTPVITAVYLDNIRDVQRLKTLFDQRWEEAEQESPKPSNPGDAGSRWDGLRRLAGRAARRVVHVDSHARPDLQPLAPGSSPSGSGAPAPRP